MSTIADDVSYQLMSDIDMFTGKMNFFGVIYIFVGIVIPVMLAILSGIRNAPLGSNVSFLNALPLTPLVVALAFLVVFPMIFLMLVLYIKSIKPNM
jgi:phosphotransferase system  glucose/maltose/N-acetylglucosamine-specific IIC component